MTRNLFKYALGVLMLSLLPLMQVDACSNVIVTKGASKDGSVIISYSADSHQLYGELYHKPAGFFAKGKFLDVVEWDTGKPLGRMSEYARHSILSAI